VASAGGLGSAGAEEAARKGQYARIPRTGSTQHVERNDFSPASRQDVRQPHSPVLPGQGPSPNNRSRNMSNAFDPTAVRYVSLTTFRRDGREVRTPVWTAQSGGRCYIFSEAHVGKVKRIRNNGRARIAPCTMRGAITGPFVDAHARLVHDAATVAQAYAALHAKYGWQMWLIDALSKLSGRYDKRVIIEIEPLA
jgi:PPOX class probable F420-dependent enzyme